jgi:hypothetical protein
MRANVDHTASRIPPTDQLDRFATLIADETIRPFSVLPAPGDLIGFSGDSWLSGLINLATLGWPGIGLSHVGIVAQQYSGRLVLVESTTIAPEPCIIRRHHVRGAQMHDLVDVLQRPGRIYHYPLAVPLSGADSDRLRDYMTDLVRAEKPYDFVGAAKSRFTPLALLRMWLHGRESLGMLFCSETCAAGLRYVGRLAIRNASSLAPNQLCRRCVRQWVLCPAVRLK